MNAKIPNEYFIVAGLLLIMSAYFLLLVNH